LSGQQGRRSEALAAITNAAAIRASVELRNEAIAAFALTDLEPEGRPHSLPTRYRQVFQFGLFHYAVSTSEGNFVIFRSRDHAEVARLRVRDAGLGVETFLSRFDFTR